MQDHLVSRRDEVVAMPRTSATSRRQQARRQLDTVASELRSVRPAFARPQAGWVESIRQAVGMARKDMAARMGVTESTIARLEASERAETVQLGTLRRAAEALDCDLVYALVPRRSLDEMVMDQGQKQVATVISAAAHTMLLEDQMPSDRSMQEVIDEAVRTRIDRPGLWNDRP